MRVESRLSGHLAVVCSKSPCANTHGFPGPLPDGRGADRGCRPLPDGRGTDRRRRIAHGDVVLYQGRHVQARWLRYGQTPTSGQSAGAQLL